MLMLGPILQMPHREDDGWWEGEYDGQRGLFPSVIADECRWDGEPLFPDVRTNFRNFPHFHQLSPSTLSRICVERLRLLKLIKLK